MARRFALLQPNQLSTPLTVEIYVAQFRRTSTGCVPRLACQASADKSGPRSESRNRATEELRARTVSRLRDVPPRHITVCVKLLLQDFHVQEGQSLKIVGDGDAFGNWTADAAPFLVYEGSGAWSCQQFFTPGLYLFKVVLVDTNGVTRWESGPNRELQVPASLNTVLHVAVEDLQFPTSETAAEPTDPEVIVAELLRRKRELQRTIEDLEGRVKGPEEQMQDDLSTSGPGDVDIPTDIRTEVSTSYKGDQPVKQPYHLDIQSSSAPIEPASQVVTEATAEREPRNQIPTNKTGKEDILEQLAELLQSRVISGLLDTTATQDALRRVQNEVRQQTIVATDMPQAARSREGPSQPVSRVAGQAEPSRSQPTDDVAASTAFPKNNGLLGGPDQTRSFASMWKKAKQGVLPKTSRDTSLGKVTAADAVDVQKETVKSIVSSPADYSKDFHKQARVPEPPPSLDTSELAAAEELNDSSMEELSQDVLVLLDKVQACRSMLSSFSSAVVERSEYFLREDDRNNVQDMPATEASTTALHSSWHEPQVDGATPPEEETSSTFDSEKTVESLPSTAAFSQSDEQQLSSSRETVSTTNFVVVNTQELDGSLVWDTVTSSLKKLPVSTSSSYTVITESSSYSTTPQDISAQFFGQTSLLFGQMAQDAKLEPETPNWRADSSFEYATGTPVASTPAAAAFAVVSEAPDFLSSPADITNTSSTDADVATARVAEPVSTFTPGKAGLASPDGASIADLKTAESASTSTDRATEDQGAVDWESRKRSRFQEKLKKGAASTKLSDASSAGSPSAADVQSMPASRSEVDRVYDILSQFPFQLFADDETSNLSGSGKAEDPAPASTGNGNQVAAPGWQEQQSKDRQFQNTAPANVQESEPTFDGLSSWVQQQTIDFGDVSTDRGAARQPQNGAAEPTAPELQEASSLLADIQQLLQQHEQNLATANGAGLGPQDGSLLDELVSETKMVLRNLAVKFGDAETGDSRSSGRGPVSYPVSDLSDSDDASSEASFRSEAYSDYYYQSTGRSSKEGARSTPAMTFTVPSAKEEPVPSTTSDDFPSWETDPWAMPTDAGDAAKTFSVPSRPQAPAPAAAQSASSVVGGADSNSAVASDALQDCLRDLNLLESEWMGFDTQTGRMVEPQSVGRATPGPPATVVAPAVPPPAEQGGPAVPAGSGSAQEDHFDNVMERVLQKLMNLDAEFDSPKVSAPRFEPQFAGGAQPGSIPMYDGSGTLRLAVQAGAGNRPGVALVSDRDQPRVMEASRASFGNTLGGFPGVEENVEFGGVEEDDQEVMVRVRAGPRGGAQARTADADATVGIVDTELYSLVDRAKQRLDRVEAALELSQTTPVPPAEDTVAQLEAQEDRWGPTGVGPPHPGQTQESLSNQAWYDMSQLAQDLDAIIPGDVPLVEEDGNRVSEDVDSEDEVEDESKQKAFAELVEKAKRKIDLLEEEFSSRLELAVVQESAEVAPQLPEQRVAVQRQKESEVDPMSPQPPKVTRVGWLNSRKADDWDEDDDAGNGTPYSTASSSGSRSGFNDLGAQSTAGKLLQQAGGLVLNGVGAALVQVPSLLGDLKQRLDKLQTQAAEYEPQEPSWGRSSSSGRYRQDEQQEDEESRYQSGWSDDRRGADRNRRGGSSYGSRTSPSYGEREREDAGLSSRQQRQAGSYDSYTRGAVDRDEQYADDEDDVPSSTMRISRTARNQPRQPNGDWANY